MHEKRFSREIERLRDPERVARMEVKRVVDLALEGLAIKSVLDVGMGSGLFAEEFAARGLQVSGLDANPAMIPAAAGFVPSGTFKEGIAEKLPFADGAFDLVFMGLVLHETDDTPAALKEAHRVLGLRLAVLEWPLEEQPFGPPLSDRLPGERIAGMAQEAGFTHFNSLRLENMVLYRIEP